MKSRCCEIDLVVVSGLYVCPECGQVDEELQVFDIVSSRSEIRAIENQRIKKSYFLTFDLKRAMKLNNQLSYKIKRADKFRKLLESLLTNQHIQIPDYQKTEILTNIKNNVRLQRGNLQLQFLTLIIYYVRSLQSYGYIINLNEIKDLLTEREKSHFAKMLFQRYMQNIPIETRVVYYINTTTFNEKIKEKAVKISKILTNKLIGKRPQTIAGICLALAGHPNINRAEISRQLKILNKNLSTKMLWTVGKFLKK